MPAACSQPLHVAKDTELVHGEIKRGTKIICYLKEDQSEFLEDAAVFSSTWVEAILPGGFRGIVWHVVVRAFKLRLPDQRKGVTRLALRIEDISSLELQ